MFLKQENRVISGQIVVKELLRGNSNPLKNKGISGNLYYVTKLNILLLSKCDFLYKTKTSGKTPDVFI